MIKHYPENNKAVCGATASDWLLDDRFYDCPHCKQILLDRIDATGPWEMYANRSTDGFIRHFGSRKYVELHMSKDPIVKVRMDVDTEGEYWGWMEYGKEQPSLIWESELSFNLCFAGGYQIKVDNLDGIVVRMKATIIE